jgi:hypothetical protein
VPRTYDPEFRRRVVELVRAGRPVRVVAVELGLAEATVYRWKAQDLVDHGIKAGLSTSERVSWLRPSAGSRSWRPNWPWSSRPRSCSRRGCAQSHLPGHR